MLDLIKDVAISLDVSSVWRSLTEHVGGDETGRRFTGGLV